MNLVEAAHSSIAFNTSIAEKLNAQASTFDPRLFCFAYYEPTALPDNTDPFMIFHLAVLNMYGLLWDCGPMIKEMIFKKKTYAALCRDINKMHECQNFLHTVYAIRTDICHNNSSKLYFNAVLKDESRNYMEKHCCTVNQNIDLNKLCSFFFKECEFFINELSNVITQSISKGDGEIKRAWLDAICNWYQKDEHFFMHVLADKYKMKALSLHGQRREITKRSVQDWVNNVQNSVGQSYESYWQKCKRRIADLLIGRDCPKPALPLEFFHQITRDVHNF